MKIISYIHKVEISPLRCTSVVRSESDGMAMGLCAYWASVNDLGVHHDFKIHNHLAKQSDC